MSVVEILPPALFLVVGISGLISWAVGLCFMRHLREHQTGLWTDLGSPGFFRKGSARFGLLEFVRSHPYHELHDNRLKLLGKLYYALFAVVVVSLVIGSILLVYNRVA